MWPCLSPEMFFHLIRSNRSNCGLWQNFPSFIDNQAKQSIILCCGHQNGCLGAAEPVPRVWFRRGRERKFLPVIIETGGKLPWPAVMAAEGPARQPSACKRSSNYRFHWRPLCYWQPVLLQIYRTSMKPIGEGCDHIRWKDKTLTVLWIWLIKL